MSTDDYVRSCLNSLSDPNFYEELPDDPNPKYRTELDENIDDLLSSNISNEFETSKLQEGSRILLTSMAYLKYTTSLTDFLLYDHYIVD